MQISLSSRSQPTSQNIHTKNTAQKINMKLVPVAFVMVGLVLTSCALVHTSSSCDQNCRERCSKAGVQDRCLKYCGICCEECQCVPSGTYGNKHECPCYRDKVNSKGKPKCP